MTDWAKETLKLKKNHSWKAKPGYRIFVADRGAVRFDFPQDWVLEPTSDCIKLLDVEPPDDSCTLAVSYIRLPPIDWSGLPLSQLVASVIEGDEREILSKGQIIDVKREDLEMSWIELSFVDPNEKREAFSRICLGRGSGIQSLITLDFWPEDRTRIEGCGTPFSSLCSWAFTSRIRPPE